MMLEFLRTNPNVLLGIAIFAFGLMMIAIYCVIKMTRIMLPSLRLVKVNSPDLYREILGTNSESWVERGVGSFRDFSTSCRLMLYLYHDERISDIIGEEVQQRFCRYVRWLLFAFPAAIAVGGSVIAIGFALERVGSGV